MIYHALLHGLALLFSAPPLDSFAEGSRPSTTAELVFRARELLRLVTNMVLQAYSEVTHVY